MAKQPLNEATPAETAKSMGLTYLGFGGWGYASDPKRKVVARTIDGKLVRVEDDAQANQKATDAGRLIIVDFDDHLLYADLQTPTDAVRRYVHLLKTVVRTGSETIVLHSRNAEKQVAKFLKQIGVTAGPKLVPYGSSEPNKKKLLVQQKIKTGFTEIQFFDRDPHAIHAVESLKAPYNKLKVKIETHQIPPLSDADTKTTPPPDSQR
jgi:hypothetical protein